MRRAFFGSHRDRVEAADAIQAGRRRRRISLEVDQFERPGGRGPVTTSHVEESPEVESYLAALSVADRPRRASLDCPESVRRREPFSEASLFPYRGEDIFGYEEDEYSPWSQQLLLQEHQQQAAAGQPGAAKSSGSGSTPESSNHGAATVHRDHISYAEGPGVSCTQPGATSPSSSRGILSSARSACASLVRKGTRNPLKPQAVSGLLTGTPEAPGTGGSSSPGPSTVLALGSTESVAGGPPAALPQFPDMFMKSAPRALTAPSRFPDMMETEVPAVPAAAPTLRHSDADPGPWDAWPGPASALAAPELMEAQASLVQDSQATNRLLAAVWGPGKP